MSQPTPYLLGTIIKLYVYIYAILTVSEDLFLSASANCVSLCRQQDLFVSVSVRPVCLCVSKYTCVSCLYCGYVGATLQHSSLTFTLLTVGATVVRLPAMSHKAKPKKNQGDREGASPANDPAAGETGQSGLSDVLMLMQQQMQQQQLHMQQQQENFQQLLRDEKEHRRQQQEMQEAKRAGLEQAALEAQRQQALQLEQLREDAERRDAALAAEKEAREAAERERVKNRKEAEQEKDRQHQLQMKLLEEKITAASAKAEIERAMEQRLAREEDKKYKEKKDIQDSINKSAKAIPKPPLMRDDEDIQDYLDMFKITQTKRMIPKKQWPSHLTPSLPPRFRMVVTRLSADDQDDFDKIEDTLLKSASLSPQMNVKKWWELHHGTHCLG